MKVQTRNTLYTLKDCGDGAFLVSGHKTFCPKPTMVRLLFPPRVGNSLVWEYVDAKAKGMVGQVVTTSHVVSIRG